MTENATRERRIDALMRACSANGHPIPLTCAIIGLDAADAVSEPTPPSQRMTTYKMKDGETIAGEYGWVSTLDYFDYDDEPNDLIEETWVRVAVKEMQYPPPKCLECSDTDAPLRQTDDGLLCAKCEAEYATKAMDATP